MDQTQVVADALPALCISTDMFDERERFDAWRESYALKVTRVDVQTPDRDAFRAVTRAQALDRLSVATTNYTCASVLRTRELVRDGRDDLHLVAVSSGTLHLRLGDEVAKVGVGEAALTTSGLVGSSNSDGPGSNFSIRVPRALAPEMFGTARPPLLRTIPAERPALRLLRLFGLGLVREGAGLDAAAAKLADRQLRELIAHVFDPTAELERAAPANGVKTARLRAIMVGIEQNLINPQLGVTWLGAKLGLSSRYVQHLLAEQNLNFSELVRRKRVERARQMLEQRSAVTTRVVDVAFAVGFGDLSSFNRAFRARFGCTPSDVLHQRVLN